MGAAAPRPALDREKCADQQQHEQGKAASACQRAPLNPGGISGNRQRFDSQVLHRANVVQRFHQCERDACRKRWPRHGQCHLEKAFTCRAAKRARGIQRRLRLPEKTRAGVEVDVRIEHGGQYKNCAAKRMDVRKPARATARSHQPADAGLQGTGKVHEIGVAIGNNVGWHRKRQQQGRSEHVAARKAESGDKPGGRRAGDKCHRADPDHQQERRQARAWKHELGKMGPVSDIAGERDGQQRENRQRDEANHGQRDEAWP